MNKQSLLAASILSLAIVLTSVVLGLCNRYSFHVQSLSTMVVVWRFDRITGKIELVSRDATLTYGEQGGPSQNR